LRGTWCPAAAIFGYRIGIGRGFEWYLAEVVRIAMADGPLTETERQAAQVIGTDLGMTQAQVVGVAAMTEQSAGRA
jgi:hypothetical protein